MHGYIYIVLLVASAMNKHLSVNVYYKIYNYSIATCKCICTHMVCVIFLVDKMCYTYLNYNIVIHDIHVDHHTYTDIPIIQV